MYINRYTIMMLVLFRNSAFQRVRAINPHVKLYFWMTRTVYKNILLIHLSLWFKWFIEIIDGILCFSEY